MKIAIVTHVIPTEIGVSNIGDAFIKKGMQFILEKAIDAPIEWFEINKFQPISKDDFKIMQKCDLIVFAGTPQYHNLDDWSHYHDKELWDDLNNVGKPILRLAGGGGYPSETMKSNEFSNYLRSSDLTLKTLEKSMKNVVLTTTRDVMAQQFLHDVGVKSTILPCTGTFACMHNNIYHSDKKINVICLDNFNFSSRNNLKTLINEFIKTKSYLESISDKPCLFLGQVARYDTPFLEKHFGRDNVISSITINGMLDIYKNTDICIASRLHCALPVYGVSNRVILLRVDTRGSAAQELGIPIINLNEYTVEKTKHIVEHNLFSQKPIDVVLNASINFYKKKMKTIKI